MLIITSPSKTQQLNLLEQQLATQPRLVKQAGQLIDILRTFKPEQLASLMKTSERLTATTLNAISSFSLEHTTENSGSALATFRGDVFSSIQVDHYQADQLSYAQKHVRILSGLYGVLRPLDLIQPYRLEMGLRLETDSGQSLYDFWGSQITETLNEDLESLADPVLIDCASAEYKKSILDQQLNASIVKVHFRQIKNGTVKTIAIHAKKARGMLIDYCIRNQITTLSGLRTFAESNYELSPESDDQNVIFTCQLE
ncbi:MAG: YaaA family protein [Desulfobulbaceae bacterium]|nr:MAG: YaaA family protein [Desulfobulbaceae bacterium]